jgi:DnaJ family protein C protein 11
MGEKKHLRVTYAFRGQLHQLQVQDLAELAMPMRIHQLS